VCELAVTRTGGVARLIEDRVRNTFGDLALMEPLAVHVSGCPHGCSQHHVAAIGLQGSVRKLGGTPVPHYFVLAGGAVEEDGARFATLAGKVAARRAPEAVTRLSLFAERAEGERAADLRARPERAQARRRPQTWRRDVRAGDLAEPGAGEGFGPKAQRGVRAA
jgi:sulfite reductase (NADPH) hemoprotein beta-component